MEFKKAERKQAKLRLALCSTSGAGKTYSALKIAKGLGGTIALIDTEHGSGSLYAGAEGMPEYSVLELDAPYTPKRYIEAMRAAEASFDIIIIDSLSHAWAGEGGILDMHDKATASSKSGNSYTAWRDVTPEHSKLVDAILQSKCHVIATMRTKQEYVLTTDDKGRQQPKKVGMSPIQREGMDYEFTVVFDLSLEHIATTSKDRTSLFDGQYFKPSEATGMQLIEWLNRGMSEPAAPPTEKPAAKATPEAAHPQPPSDNVTEFWRAAKEQGYNPATESGLAALKTWMVSHGTSLKFQELSDEKQKELIAAMRQSKMPFGK